MQRNNLWIRKTQRMQHRSPQHQEQDNRRIQQHRLRTTIGNRTHIALVGTVRLDISSSAQDSGQDEPVNVHDGDQGRKAPELDRVAEIGVMTFPDRDALFLVCGRGDFGDGVLELGSGTEVVSPDGEEVAEEDGKETDDGPVEVHLVEDKVRLDLFLPEDKVVGEHPG